MALSRAGFTVLGVDVNDEVLAEVEALAKEEGLENLELRNVDATTMEFSYKAINMAGLAHFVPEVALKVIKNAVRQGVNYISVVPVTEEMHEMLVEHGYGLQTPLSGKSKRTESDSYQLPDTEDWLRVYHNI